MLASLLPNLLQNFFMNKQNVKRNNLVIIYWVIDNCKNLKRGKIWLRASSKTLISRGFEFYKKRINHIEKFSRWYIEESLKRF